MKREKRFFPVACITILVCFAVLLFSLLFWRNSVLDRFVQIPNSMNIDRFIDSQDNLDIVATFHDPIEIEGLVDMIIDREVYESRLVSLARSNLSEDDDQVNYLFRDKRTGEYGTISFIQFHDTSSALFKFHFAVDDPLVKTEYVTPWKFCMPGEPEVTFFLPTWTQRGYEQYALEDGLMRSYWFENEHGIQLTVESSQHEMIRQDFIRFCRER